MAPVFRVARFLVMAGLVFGNGAGSAQGAVSAFYVATGAFMFVVYTYWSRGTWWYANSDAVGDWKGFVIPFEIAAWISVCVVLVWMARAVTEERRPAIA